MTDISTVIGPRGHPHIIKMVRSKRRMDGRLAGGALYPQPLPIIDKTSWVDSSTPEVLQDGTKRCLKIGVWTQGDIYERASEYAYWSGSPRLMLEIERERVEAIQNHIELPQEITTITGESMTKSRWLNQSLVFSKPAGLTSEQREQLLAAGYWSREASDPQVKCHAQSILDYYGEMGYCIELRRPYKRRSEKLDSKKKWNEKSNEPL